MFHAATVNNLPGFNQPMRKYLSLFAVGAAALLLLPSAARATSNGYSIGLNFGADEYPATPPIVPAPGFLAPTDIAGVPGVQQGNWNNLTLLEGSSDATVWADNAGQAVDVGASIYFTWTSANTWATDRPWCCRQLVSDEFGGFQAVDRLSGHVGHLNELHLYLGICLPS